MIRECEQSLIVSANVRRGIAEKIVHSPKKLFVGLIAKQSKIFCHLALFAKRLFVLFAEGIRLAFVKKAESDWLIFADMSNKSWDNLSDLAAILKNILSGSHFEWNGATANFQLYYTNL